MKKIQGTGQLTEELPTEAASPWSKHFFLIAVQGLAAALSRRHRQLRVFVPSVFAVPFPKGTNAALPFAKGNGWQSISQRLHMLTQHVSHVCSPLCAILFSKALSFKVSFLCTLRSQAKIVPS